MAIVETKESTTGGCPRCDYLLSERDLFERLRGHLSDGITWVVCPNCQEELTVEIKLSSDQVLGVQEQR